MTALEEALRWFNDPLVWSGPAGIVARTGEHLGMSALAVLLAAVVALPLGIWLGHRGRGGGAVVAVVNASRALPTFAILLILASTGFGFGNRPTVVAAAVFALPPILVNAWAGVRDVDPALREAARGMGMSGFRSLLSVELPLALPLVAAGLRSATVQVIATVSLAALVGGGGLGRFVVDGFATRRFGIVVGGALLIAVLCLLAEALMALTQRALTPAALRSSARTPA